MRRGVRLTLWLMALLLTALASATGGFYFGAVEAGRIMTKMAASDGAFVALSEVRTSLLGLGSSDLNQSQHQWALHLRAALISLGSLSKSGAMMLCDDRDNKALADASAYVKDHRDNQAFDHDPLFIAGLASCKGKRAPEVKVSFLGVGQGGG